MVRGEGKVEMSGYKVLKYFKCTVRIFFWMHNQLFLIINGALRYNLVHEEKRKKEKITGIRIRIEETDP